MLKQWQFDEFMFNAINNTLIKLTCLLPWAMCGHQATTLNDRDTTRMQICLSPYPKQTQTDHNNFNHSVSQLVRWSVAEPIDQPIISETIFPTNHLTGWLVQKSVFLTNHLADTSKTNITTTKWQNNNVNNN